MLAIAIENQTELGILTFNKQQLKLMEKKKLLELAQNVLKHKKRLSYKSFFYKKSQKTAAFLYLKHNGYLFSGSITALILRTPAPLLSSLTILKCPSSPVFLACGPPHISLLTVPIV